MNNVVGNIGCCVGMLLAMALVIALVWAAARCSDGQLDNEGAYDYDCAKEVGKW